MIAKISEADTRAKLIDPALARAGWDLDDANQVGFEIPVDDAEPAAWHALEARLKARGGRGAVRRRPAHGYH
jgi:hypothetical protein